MNVKQAITGGRYVDLVNPCRFPRRIRAEVIQENRVYVCWEDLMLTLPSSGNGTS